MIDEIHDICFTAESKDGFHTLFSSIKTDPQDIGVAYDELIELANSHFTLTFTPITKYEYLSSEIDNSTASYYSINQAELSELIMENNATKIIDWFSQLEKDIKHTNLPEGVQASMISSNIYHQLMNLLDKRCDIPSQNYLSPEATYTKLMQQNNLEDMFVTLATTALDISNIIKYTSKPIYTDTFQSALSYIDIHYCEPDFSLEKVAKYANMGRCYLSALFTQNIGKTFIEHLTEIRMTKAIELMKDSSKMVYEIAEEVGYQNSTYFSTVFKKYYKISPKEYRNRNA